MGHALCFPPGLYNPCREAGVGPTLFTRTASRLSWKIFLAPSRLRAPRGARVYTTNNQNRNASSRTNIHYTDNWKKINVPRRCNFYCKTVNSIFPKTFRRWFRSYGIIEELNFAKNQHFRHISMNSKFFNIFCVTLSKTVNIFWKEKF